MNERLSLQDLIDSLAKKQDITKKESEAFLRELIATISETIEQNEQVKIKDFGVFKLVKVSARKSVDVNTGEAIEIPAHYKLSFTPDKAFKEAINKPFAHFESVILEEGVTFENLKDEVSETSNDLEDEDTDLPAENVVEQTNQSDESIPVDLNVSEEVIQGVIPEKEEEAEEQQPDIIEDVQSIVVENKEPDVIVTPENIESPTIESVLEHNERRTKRRRFISLGLILFLIIAAFAIGGYYFNEAASFLTGTADNKHKVVIDYAAKADSLKQTTDTLYSDSIQVVEKTESVLLQESPDLNKPLAMETIKSGHTLRNIALQYYGHKSFWIYIYEENKSLIKNPNNVPLGTKLVIPAPEKYGIDAKNSESVQKAKIAEEKLFREMGL